MRGPDCCVSLVMGSLARINQSESDHAESRDARQEKVVTATEFNEIRQATADEGRVCRRSIALDDETSMTSVAAHQDVFVVTQMRVVAVLDPLLLYELELPGKAGVQRHEDHTAIVCVRDRLIFAGEVPIGQAATRDAAPIN